MRPLMLTLAFVAFGAASPSPSPSPSPAPSASPSGVLPFDGFARQYVQLVLWWGEHDPGYVDAYYGPKEWQERGDKPLPERAEIRRQAEELRAAIQKHAVQPGSELALRQAYLARQLEALIARADMLGGKKLSFDEESRALYDAVAPARAERDFQQALARLEKAVPGEGPLAQRYETFRKRYLVPADKLDGVFRAAIAECRRRTLQHIALPREESFQLEYVKDKPWGGYNWYKGGYHSLIQVNTDLPTAIDRAVDLACHEGYPGHHVYNVLLEQHLVRGRGWQEFTVYALYSPQSLIAEGTANYGIAVAFPGDERRGFERDTLFPLAGFDPRDAAAYHAVQTEQRLLAGASTETARRYLDGQLSGDEAVRWLRTYSLMTEEQARQRLKFFDTYRSYTINYTLGRELVAAYIQRRGGTDKQPQRRWQEFKDLLASPLLPGNLK